MAPDVDLLSIVDVYDLDPGIIELLLNPDFTKTFDPVPKDGATDPKVQTFTLYMPSSTGKVLNYSATHHLLTDDKELLESTLSTFTKAGMIVINGNPSVTERFIEYAEKALPVFVFKYTGSSADLMSEAWDIIQNKRQASAKRSIPTNTDVLIPDNYVKRQWLEPFDAKKDQDKYKKSHTMINTFMGNLPDDSKQVIQFIDIFKTK